MVLNKVYAAATEDDEGVTLASTEDGTQSNSRPPLLKKLTVKSAPRKQKDSFYYRLRHRVLNQYNRLSWNTRQTINVAISSVAVLYAFISVPFRIGFLYNPFDATEEERHQWTWELTVFTPLDMVTDLIGVMEFLHFYGLWKNALTHKEEETNFDEDVKLMRGASKRLRNTNVLLRARTSVGLRQGKAKWTLANIGRTTTIYDSSADDMTLEKQSRVARKWELALEIFALVPFEIIPFALGEYGNLHLAHVNKLCRFYKIRRFFSRLSKIYSDRPWVQHLSSTGIRSLVRTIGYCAGMCHWVACGYMFIAHAQCGVSLRECDPSAETSWIVRDRLHGATVSRKYGRTLYWASRTLVLLGYDDVTPISNAETIYGIFVQLVGALFSSSMLATFLFIFRFRNARYAAYSAHVDNAREYMHTNNIPRVIRHKVMAYFTYTWDTHHGLDSEEALHLMPKHLQSKVIATLKASRIRQVNFLAKESVEFINLLALALQRRIYSPTDRIIEPRTNAHMFFVIRGNVMITAANNTNPRECLTGDYFAEICLLFPEQFVEKAVARTFCELYVLSKAKFDDIITHFYRGNEAIVRAQMAESLVRYVTQQRKTQKVLGNDGRDRSSLRITYRRMSDLYVPGVPKDIVWNFPDSTFRIVWDTLRLLGVIYVAFEVPYYAVFVSMADGENMFVETSFVNLRYLCTILTEAFFGVDIILQARFLAYLDPVAMLNVENPSLIFDAYRHNGFYLDLLAWLPVGLVLESIRSVSQYAWLFRLLRLFRLRLFPYLLRDLADAYSLSSKIHLFVSLLLSVTLLLHVVGCGWFETAWIPRGTQSFTSDNMKAMHALTRSECLRHATLFGNCSWIKYDCYANVGEVFPVEDNSSSYEGTFAYVRAVYWSVVTLTAVGYGDIVAFSTAESYVAAAWVFVGGIINFGVVGAMSSTIANAMAARHHHLELLNTINSVMGRLSISEKLSAEIRRFYIHHFTGRKVAYESQLLSHLPDQLCYQISSLLHAEAVKSVRLFDFASRKFLQQITGKFRHRTYENGETIFIEGDVCREFIVLLRGSKVNVFFRTRKVPARALQEGDCYGVYEFLLRRAHTATLTAASTVQASVMTRVEFDVIQRKFDEDVRNLKIEAQILCDEQQAGLRRVARNLERLKLKPHVIQTPSLFYQQDTVVESSNKKNSTIAIRDTYATRTTFIHAWNAGVTFWNVYNALFVIFRIGFHSHLHFSSELNLLVWFMDLYGDVYFAIDIYLHLYFFGNADVSVENLVHRKWVDTVYRRSNAFKWDLVASLPLYIPVTSEALVVSVCRLPRLIRCLDLWVYLDEVIVQVQQHFASRNVSSYLGPVKLMVVLVLVAHFVGCIFLWISEHECDYYENCWIAHDHLIHEYHHALPVLYAKTFYWAITTLLLVGSREIVPRDILGTIWTLITCLGCTFAMGYIVGEISELILDFGKETKQYKYRLANFEGFAQANELPESLRERVGFFFRAQFENTYGHDLDHTVHKLSANLRLRLLLEVYGGSLARLPITHFLSSAQINNMALRLQSELYIPGDNILVEGTLGNRLCTLRKGVAAAFWTKSVSSVAVIMEGALFGEAAFFLPDQRRLVTVRATTTCEMLYISKHDWEELWAPTGDESDVKVQKYELHSILDWVSNRLYRYQKHCLHAARKAKREMALRQEIANLLAFPAPGRRKSRMSISQLRRSSTNLLLTTSGSSMLSISRNPQQPLPVQQPRLTSMKSSLSPEMQALHKKAKYLLEKTDRYAQLARPAFAAMQLHRATLTTTGLSTRSLLRAMTTRRSILWGITTKQNLGPIRSMGPSFHRGGNGAGPPIRAARSTRGDSPPRHQKGVNTSAHKIIQNQFIVDLNPINKHLKGTLADDTLQRLEDECWQRFKLIAAMQQCVRELLDTLIPPEHDLTRTYNIRAATGFQSQAPHKNPSTRKSRKLEKMHSAHMDELEMHKKGAELLAKQSRAKHRRLVNPAAKPASQKVVLPGKSSSSNIRRFTTGVKHLHHGRHGALWGSKNGPNEETNATLERMRRCRSLPTFSNNFFEAIREEEANRLMVEDVWTVGADIDFETIKRCQRPQYESQLRLYHQYRIWKGLDGVETVANHESRQHQRKSSRSSKRHSRRRSLRSHLQVANSLRRISGRFDSHDQVDAQLIFQRSLRAEATDRKTKEFIRLIKRVGKIWDAIMLLVAVYHVFITPFKLCFPHELIELNANSLRVWAGFEILLDVLCLFDVAHKVNQASFATHGSGTKVAKSKRMSLRYILESNSRLLVDIVAVLPLELLLLAGGVRVSLQDEAAEEVDLNWWTTRWVLRVNRILFAWRIEPLSEEILQYLMYECGLDISEALVSFMRALASYLTMAHFLACLWFATSDYGLHQYGTSWLSTSGMLTYIEPVTTTSHRERSRRALSTSTSDSFLDHVPLGRKYLRSLYFSIECITTLFYGDILSMNRLELMVEIAITLWAIYIYGALVGAQGELLDSSARHEASFEQNLAELQLYLVQNEVPKILKRHIKAYYAHIWHRSRGDKDFAVIEGTSRALHEDVVVATLQDFAVRVEVFRALDEPFLRALLVCLQYVVCSQGEDVVVAGDVDRCMYFIANGRIRVHLGDTDTPRGRGEFFGELSLLYGISRLETCVAMTVAELYRLDHEPYERVLVDFPEYRVRNKLAWSTVTSTSFDRLLLEKTVQARKKQGVSAVVPVNMRALAAEEEANRLEAEVPRSYVFLSTMEMLARLHDMDPLQAKELILKCRNAARKHVKKHQVGNAFLGTSLEVIPTGKHKEQHEDIVQHISPRTAKPTKIGTKRRSFQKIPVTDLDEDMKPPGLLDLQD
ncbi:unnamed protein product [Phytophthora fragariaefolia]|uniref:Unnamed protein product n=1 Tax=Phytophthora fragariaefolia TaxID=1490495 RepID=A0A9W6Y744_9STRA|nr:unnamed protein product [Phytophthora fragariaefolia]